MLGEWFETRVRESGESFVTLVEDTPTWLRDLIMDAHDGEMPNDWRYGICADIARAFDEPDGIDPDELVDSLVDTSTFDLISWMGDNLARVGDVDSANDDYGWSHDHGVIGMIRLGQYSVISAMVELFVSGLDELASGES